MIAEIVISDYWADRIEILFALVSGIALGVMTRMMWERNR